VQKDEPHSVSIRSLTSDLLVDMLYIYLGAPKADAILNVV